MPREGELTGLLDSLFACYENLVDEVKELEKHLRCLEAWEQGYVKEGKEAASDAGG